MVELAYSRLVSAIQTISFIVELLFLYRLRTRGLDAYCIVDS